MRKALVILQRTVNFTCVQKMEWEMPEWKLKKNFSKESNMAAVYYRFHGNNKCYEH